MNKPEIIQELLIASENKYETDVILTDGTVVSGQVEFVKKSVSVNGKPVVLDDIHEVRKHIESSIRNTLMEMLSECLYIKLKDTNEVINGYLMDCSDETIEIVTTEGSQKIAIDNVEAVSEDPIVCSAEDSIPQEPQTENCDNSVDDADSRFPFGGFEKRLYLADFIDKREKEEVLEKFCNFEYQDALDLMGRIQVADEKKDELYEYIEYLQNVVSRYEENEPKLKKEYGRCYYGGLSGLVEQNIPKCMHYYLQEIDPWGQFGALALTLCIATIYKLTDKNIKHENAIRLMKYIPQMENITGQYSQAQAYKSLLVIFAFCEDWDNYEFVLTLLVDILREEEHFIAASNALLKYTKKLAEEGQFDLALRFAQKGFEICDPASVLILILYIEDRKSGNENIEERMKEYLVNSQIGAVWEKVAADELPKYINAIYKSEYVDEYWKKQTGNQDKSDAQSEKNTTDSAADGNFSSAIVQIIEDEVSEEWESSFANYRKSGQISQARKYFKKKAVQFGSDKLTEILARIEIWQNQFGSYKSINAPSTEYEKGMYKWFAEKKGVEASEYFFNSIQSSDADRNTAFFTFLDVMAVEYGFEQAVEKVSVLRPYIKDMEKAIKIPFYEKVYSLAVFANDNAVALSALNSLQSLYYSKNQLGKTEYRIAGVYYKQEKWPKAKEHLVKALDYAFNVPLTSRMLENVEKAIEGEEVLPFAFENDKTKGVDVDSIKSKIESYYDEMQYVEARDYIRKLCENNPDNRELIVLRSEAEKAVENYNNYNNNQTLSRKTDNAGKAWRAWHIEENYEKAERYYRAGIKAKGKRMMACLFDLSEMKMHVEGNAQGIMCLLDEEETIKTLDEASQISFYEKLNLMLSKTEDIEKRKECLDVLMELYVRKDNKEKIAFTYYRMGINSLSSKEYDDAIRLFQKAIEHKYNFPTICYQYIVSAYIKKGDFSEAINYAESVLNRKETIQDNNLVAFLNHSIEKAKSELNETSNSSDQSAADEEDDLFEDLMTEYSDKLVMYIINNPIIKQQIDTDGGDEQQKLHKYIKEVKDSKTDNIRISLHKLTVLENQINGPTQSVYVHLKRCVGAYAVDSYKHGKYDSAVLWNMYMLSNAAGKGASSDIIKSYTQRLLKCAIKDSVIKDDESIEELITKIINSDSEKAEFAFRLLCFVIAKSPYLYEKGIASYMEKNHLFGEQIYRFLNKAMMLDDQKVVSPESLVVSIHERVKVDTDSVQMLIGKFRSSRTLNEDYIDDLRHLRDAIFVLENDYSIINDFISIYEKAMEIYDYPDYENRLATVRLVQTGLIDINNKIDDRPTYFGIYYFVDIVDATLTLVSNVSNNTIEELAPELSITVPITEIETIDDRQVISVTVSNKENTASATSLFIYVYDSEGNDLLENGGVELAPNLRGGNSKSIELEIKAIKKNTFSIRIKVQYKNHKDEICVCEKDETISCGSTSYEEISGNPYVDGKALDPNKNRNVFMGREALLNHLSTSLLDDSGQCLIIYGQKRSGKTSISNFLQERINEQFLIISFSAGSAISASQLYNNVRTKLMLELQKKIYGKNSPITEEENASLMELHSELRSMKIENGESFIDMMRTIFGGYCIRYDKEILIIIDEFTHLYRLYQRGGSERDEVTAFMDTWKKGSEEKLFKSLLIGQDTMPYIMAAYPNQLAITDPRRVDRLDDESVRDLIEKPILLSNGETRYMEKSVDLISDWFYGQPYYISVYCKRMVEHMKASRKTYITNAMAEAVKNQMLRSSTISFFDNLINAGDIETSTDDELKTLPTYRLLCSIANLTKNSEWANIDDIDIPEKERLIEDLIHRSVIEKRKGKCRIYINFFKEWLNEYGRE